MPLAPRSRSGTIVMVAIVAIACSRKTPAPLPAGDAAAVVGADAGRCPTVASFVGSHTCRLGGGSEDGSRCDDFHVGVYGDRAIVEPKPDESDFAGTAVADGDGPVHGTTELARGWPKVLTGLPFYFSRSFAGVWPRRFFLVGRTLEASPRVMVFPWQRDRWGAPILDRAVAGDVFPEAVTTGSGETVLTLGRETFRLELHRAVAVPPRDAEAAPARPPRRGCIGLPRLERNDGGLGYHEAPEGLVLAVDRDDGTWLQAHHDEETEHSGPRTYFLFRSRRERDASP